MRDILAGEELTINYNGDFDDARPVWFQDLGERP
jgi:SET domain-containing protein